VVSKTITIRIPGKPKLVWSQTALSNSFGLTWSFGTYPSPQPQGVRYVITGAGFSGATTRTDIHTGTENSTSLKAPDTVYNATFDATSSLAKAGTYDYPGYFYSRREVSLTTPRTPTATWLNKWDTANNKNDLTFSWFTPQATGFLDATISETVNSTTSSIKTCENADVATAVCQSPSYNEGSTYSGRLDGTATTVNPGTDDGDANGPTKGTYYFADLPAAEPLFKVPKVTLFQYVQTTVDNSQGIKFETKTADDTALLSPYINIKFCETPYPSGPEVCSTSIQTTASMLDPALYFAAKHAGSEYSFEISGYGNTSFTTGQPDQTATLVPQKFFVKIPGPAVVSIDQDPLNAQNWLAEYTVSDALVDNVKFGTNSIGPSDCVNNAAAITSSSGSIAGPALPGVTYYACLTGYAIAFPPLGTNTLAGYWFIGDIEDHYTSTDVKITFNYRYPNPLGGAPSTQGTLSPSYTSYEQAVIFGTTPRLDSNRWVLDGYRFVHWIDNSVVPTVTYSDAQQLASALTTDLSLSAIWEPLDITISFDTNSPVAPPSPFTVNTVNPNNIKFDQPTTLLGQISIQGYQFLGWNTDPDAIAPTYPAGPSGGPGTLYFKDQYTNKYDKTLTFYAIWKDLDVVLEFNANGGAGNMDNQPLDFSEKNDVSISANTYTRDLHQFLGWTSNPAGDGKAYPNSGTYTAGDVADTSGTVTLYAQWATFDFGQRDDNTLTVSWRILATAPPAQNPNLNIEVS
jgi:hypothetical protein